jgi:hypothetical protein
LSHASWTAEPLVLSPDILRLHYSADPDKDPATPAGKLWYCNRAPLILFGLQLRIPWGFRNPVSGAFN